MNFINELSISNFKSIQHIELKPKKFNLFIGKPNVGKSNIIEALSLLGLHNFLENGSQLDNEAVRFESTRNFFFNNHKEIRIKSNLLELSFRNENKTSYERQIFGEFTNHGVNDFIINPSDESKKEKLENFTFWIDDRGNFDPISGNWQSKLNPIKLYLFDEKKTLENRKFKYSNSLIPPFGSNLTSMIESTGLIMQELSEILDEYGLNLVFIEGENKFVIQKSVKGRIRQIPFILIADTIKRYIFHYSSIKSNEDSILLFEEPESHSFPPYIHQLAQNILASHNQYFITTHSPYIYDVFKSHRNYEDLALFYVEYKNHETIVHQLSEKIINELKEYESDIFFNIEDYFR